MGALSLAAGLGMFVFPRRKRLTAEARLAERKAQLAAGASERYFEEGRSLDAYPLPTTDAKWRMRGAFFTLCGLALLVLSVIR